MLAGHRAGTRALRRTVEAALDARRATRSASSRSRPRTGRGPTRRSRDLLDLLAETIRGEFQDLAPPGRARALRRAAATAASPSLLRLMEEHRAAHRRPTTGLDALDVCFDYGGRAEIVEAAARSCATASPPRTIDEDALRARLARPGPARPRPGHPHVRRAAPLELPALADRPTPSTSSRRRSGPTSAQDAARATPSPSTPAAAAVSAALMSDLVEPRARRALLAGRSRSRRVYLGGSACWSPFAAGRGALGARRALPHGARTRPIADRRPARRAASPSIGAPLGGGRAGRVAAHAVTLLLRSWSRRRRDEGVGDGLGRGHAARRRCGSARASPAWCCSRDTPPNDFGFNLLLAVLLGTWASDIFAYFGGRLFGRHRLAPAISPKKTVEGFVIGLVVRHLTIWCHALRRGLHAPAGRSCGIGVALAAPLGDLFESFLKRDLGVKDSGTLLAGHGGVLDRIDALLFAFPAAWIVLDLMSRV